MSDLVTELGRLNFGKDLAESLANIGKTIGEHKRREDAQKLIGDYVTKAFSPGTTVQDLVSNPKFTNIITQLQSSNEGQQAWGAFQTSMGVQDTIEKRARGNLISTAPGQEVSPTTTDANGKITVGAPIISRPGNPKTQWGDMTDADYIKFGMEPPKPRVMIGPGGAKSVVTDRHEVLGDYSSGIFQPIMGPDEKPVTRIKESKQSTPNAAAGGQSSVDTSKIDWSIEDPEEFLKQKAIDGKTRQIVHSLTGPHPPTLQDLTGMGRGGDRSTYLAIASKYRPETDIQLIKSRLKGFDSYMPGGTDNKRIVSLNNATGHLGQFADAANALENQPTEWWNSAKNMAAEKFGNLPQVAKFKATANLVLGEFEKAVTDKATVSKVEKLKDDINSSKSPGSFKGIVDAFVQLLLTRFGDESANYKANLGEMPEGKLIFPESENVLRRMGLGDEILKIKAGGAGRGTGEVTKKDPATQIKTAKAWLEENPNHPKADEVREKIKKYEKGTK